MHKVIELSYYLKQHTSVSTWVRLMSILSTLISFFPSPLSLSLSLGSANLQEHTTTLYLHNTQHTPTTHMPHLPRFSNHGDM